MDAYLATVMFGADAAAVAAAGWLAVRVFQPGAKGILEEMLGWVTAGLVLVAGSAALLGLAGGLGAGGFLGLHAAVLAALAWKRRGHWRADAAAPGDWCRRAWRAGGGGEIRPMAAVLLVVLAFSAVVAALAVPLVFDALTYRLPRIAQWLQDGRIAHLATDDLRLNYMPLGPDLVIAWLLAATSRGYALAGLAQTAGGLLLVGAALVFARRTGLSRTAAFGAAALLLGMANVAPQLASLHTDLFTAGIFAAGAALWLRAYERGEGSWLGGAGLGLALASKGTMLYLLPAAVLWAGWFIRSRREARWSPLGPTALGLVLAVALFSGPLWRRNLEAYGKFSAPAQAMLDHYGPPLPLAGRWEKTAVNLRAALAQLCDPHSQPPWLRPLIERAGRAMIAGLPRHDAYVFENSDRVGTLRLYYDFDQPDADFTGPGVAMTAAALLALAGAACFRRRSGATLTILWGAGLVLYFVTQNALFQWHPWGFRYAVLVAPWLAIVVAWGLEQLPRVARLAGWTVLLAGAAWTFAETTFHSRQSGWQGFRMSLVATHGGWHDWSNELGPEGSPLRLALPVNSPAAQFYRTSKPRPARMDRLSRLSGVTAEAAVRERPGEWLIVPARTFMGREGSVAARAWILRGDENHKISVAAYRALAPGEAPDPVLYSDRHLERDQGFARALVFRSWREEAILSLANPSAAPWSYRLSGGDNDVSGTLPAGTFVQVAVRCSPAELSRLTAEFARTSGAPDDGRVPFIRTLR